MLKHEDQAREVLWVCEASSGKSHAIPRLRINSTMGGGARWLGDSKSLLVERVPIDRGKPPVAVVVPSAPDIQESDGKRSLVRTYEDLLNNPHDEALFDYYATAQLSSVDCSSGRITDIGKPAIFSRMDPSPDGQHILIVRIHRPYSYLVPESEFPRDVEIWDRTGKLEFKLASQPLAEHVPTEGVLTGPRDDRPAGPGGVDAVADRGHLARDPVAGDVGRALRERAAREA